ncbi:calmodulin-like protein [Actinidia rufa]|uniref:Calmodulin-like protein n=1 Tax=Actinidia rufa TaxID=165716 RepID=A0A7J0F231_9ERIC|nr:calmodulin-like protein [Actinidia rufa]
MLEDDPSDSDSQENESNSSSEDLETLANGGDQKMTDYDSMRDLRRRIEQSRARMEALGLKTMASALMGSAQNTKKKSESKGKAKMVEEDEEYRPREGEEGSTSSSEENEEFSGFRRSKVISLSHRSSIALSLKDSAECPDVGCSGIPQSMCLLVIDEVKCCFTEAGKGSITLADLIRVAAAHDFTWIDKDIADMIYCFDSDGDGKLSLDEFRMIVGQCNMIQVSEKSVLGSKA